MKQLEITSVTHQNSQNSMIKMNKLTKSERFRNWFKKHHERSIKIFEAAENDACDPSKRSEFDNKNE